MRRLELQPQETEFDEVVIGESTLRVYSLMSLSNKNRSAWLRHQKAFNTASAAEDMDGQFDALFGMLTLQIPGLDRETFDGLNSDQTEALASFAVAIEEDEEAAESEDG